MTTLRRDTGCHWSSPPWTCEASSVIVNRFRLSGDV